MRTCSKDAALNVWFPSEQGRELHLPQTDKMDQKELKPEAGLEPTAFGGLLKHLDASENQCAVGVLVWEFEV